MMTSHREFFYPNSSNTRLKAYPATESNETTGTQLNSFRILSEHGSSMIPKPSSTVFVATFCLQAIPWGRWIVRNN